MRQAVQNAPGARFRANVSMAAGNHVFHFLRRIGRAAPECLRQVPHGVQIIVPVTEMATWEDGMPNREATKERDVPLL